MTLKQRVAAYLDDANRAVGAWVTAAIALLILASAAIFVVETYALSDRLQATLRIADWVILTLFTVEYGLRLWSAERPWHYALSPYGLVDLLAILPFVLGFVDMRFVRLLRWLRVLRLARLFGDRALVGRLTAADTLAVTRIVFTLFALIFIYAGIIFQIEQRFNPDTFDSFLDAAYFAVVTMTTVGFGDIAPVSEAGRWFTVLMILTGITLIPTQLSYLIRSVVKVSQAQTVPCGHCGWAIHDSDARFCKRCGTALVGMPEVGAQPTPLATTLPIAPRWLGEEAAQSTPDSSESSP
ncbi:MAG: ion transporter [Cyanobacteria bacterium]|nr:ion transporter [Cyanobacteriota bacterium]